VKDSVICFLNVEQPVTRENKEKEKEIVSFKKQIKNQGSSH
jgi:hypothetical protein